jgi:hypothetical protein
VSEELFVNGPRARAYARLATHAPFTFTFTITRCDRGGRPGRRPGQQRARSGKEVIDTL